MTTRRIPNGLSMPRPFIKWVGGKGQLLPELLQRVEQAGDFGRYHEPFVGGGALFYALHRGKLLGTKQAWLSDFNPRLVETYTGIKDDVDTVIQFLKKHQRNHCEAYYYSVREVLRESVRNESPPSAAEHAARIIYLNKTGYNGLYRENSKGLYNVPFGRYKNPLICDEANLQACANAFKKARFSVDNFDAIEKKAKPGDLVYFDPPYDPVSKTASFTSYAKGGFNSYAQKLLAKTCQALDDKNVKFMLSNSNTEFICDLYSEFTVDKVSANRNINSNATKRGAIQEVLVRNF
jgi:DNA adenine methylase